MKRTKREIPQEKEKEKKEKWKERVLKLAELVLAIAYIKIVSWIIDTPITVASTTWFLMNEPLEQLPHSGYIAFMVLLSLITGTLQAHYVFRFLLTFSNIKERVEGFVKEKKVLRYFYNLQANGYTDIVNFNKYQSSLKFIIFSIVIPAIVIHLAIILGIILMSAYLTVLTSSYWMLVSSLIGIVFIIPGIILCAEKGLKVFKRVFAFVPSGYQHMVVLTFFIAVVYSINLLSQNLT